MNCIPLLAQGCALVPVQEGHLMSVMSTMTALSNPPASSGTLKRAGLLCGWLAMICIGVSCIYSGIATFTTAVEPALRVYSYPEGSCTIRFIYFLNPSRYSIRRLPTIPNTRYVVFGLTVQTATNEEYQVAGTSTSNLYLASNNEIVTLISDYRYGKTYQCWYNPADPLQVVLKRDIPLIPFVFCSSLVAVGMLLLIKLLPHALSSLYTLSKQAIVTLERAD
jgi:hypothetical protein